MASNGNYMSWTKNGLIQRVKELEAELKSRPHETATTQPEETTAAHGENDAPASTPAKKPKGKRKMDPSKYSTRYIALKLAYLGKNYGGLEFQAMGNQSTIEEELWNALTRACLIFPKDERVVDFDCCEYSKCGRTDKGVSAFGQVVGLRVRSNRPLPKKRRRVIQPAGDGEAGEPMVVDGQTAHDAQGAAAVEEAAEVEEEEEVDSSWDPIRDELQYPRILNRLLPPDIRILAWCPSPPPDFSARFSCRERQYRYFFTQPAFSPEPSSVAAAGGEAGPARNGWLDIEAMRDAAKRFEGDHDFRNFCKIDPSKQITNFSRVIFESDIVEVEGANSALPYLQTAPFMPPADLAAQIGSGSNNAAPPPKVYYFHVRGSAFLWHQIRHMVAALFLVGQRLESPSIISQLLDTTAEPCKPNYVMADDAPLVLWDCIFPDLSDPAENVGVATAGARKVDTMQWIYLADDPALGKFGQFGVMDGLWAQWRERKMDELLANQLLQLMSQQGGGSKAIGAGEEEDNNKKGSEKQQPDSESKVVFEGGNTARMAGRYIPLLKKDRLQSADEQNERYAIRKGYAGSADMREKKGFGRRKEDESTSAE